LIAVQFVLTVFKLGTTATTIMSCITVSLEGAVIVGTKMLGRYQGEYHTHGRALGR
jgi:hypothetical protein